MHSLVAYIKEIRLKQVSREIASLGLIYTLLISLVLFFIIKAIAVSLSTLNAQLIFCLIWSAFLPTIHFSRNDVRFLQITKGKAFVYLLTDYFLLSIIPIGILIYCKGLLAALLLLLVVIIVALIPFKKRVAKQGLSELKIIPSYLIEWKSGIRKNNKFFLFGLYTVGIFASYFPFFSLFICWLVTGIICGFYQSFEPRNQLRFHHQNPVSYLKFKLSNAVINYFKIVLPILLIYSLFHPEQWIIIISALFLFICILVFTIIAKYAYYTPGETSGPHQVYFAIGLLSLFIPFMVPIPLALTFTHYRKAIKRLAPYFYGSN